MADTEKKTEDEGVASPSQRVLSIQSHVVAGYVGNKSAVFPMQLLGLDVCPVNSVQFSNHTGYGSFEGEVLHGDKLTLLMDGLETNGLLDFAHVLTGYIGSESFLRAVVDAVKRVRSVTPHATFVCDPVLGDNGKLYVPEALVGIYREVVVPVATVLTPNQFELELLTGVSIRSEAAVVTALDALHAKGVETVVVTSTSLPAGQDSVMTVYASTTWDRVAESMDVWGGHRGPGPYARFKLCIPTIAFHFTGTGDLTAALLLALYAKFPRAFVTAVERAIASVQAVCARTAATLADGKDTGADAAAVRSRELKVIESKGDLESPRVAIRAQALG